MVNVPSAVAASDCEAVGGGLLAQPVNAVSSLAFVVAGTWLLWRGLRGPAPAGGRPGRVRTVGVFGVATGFGSFLFHGFGGPTAVLLHDGSMVALLGALVAFHVDDLVAGRRGRDGRRRLRRGAVPVGVAALVCYTLGRTGAPWCDPASPFQPHAAWHVLLAAALAMWTEATWGGEPIAAPGAAQRRRSLPD